MTIRDQWAALYTAGRVRWMAGMLDEDGWRVIEDHDSDELTVCRERTAIYLDTAKMHAPDFADPATLGCLLHQAREAWDSPRLQTSPMLQPAPPEWICYPNACEDDGRRYLGDSEPAAILAAIAAAPPKVNP
jgi:hypothetical protein